MVYSKINYKSTFLEILYMCTNNVVIQCIKWNFRAEIKIYKKNVEILRVNIMLLFPGRDAGDRWMPVLAAQFHYLKFI